MYIYEIMGLSRQIEKDMNNFLSGYGITFLQWTLLRKIYFSETNLINASLISSSLSKDKRLISISLKKLEEMYYIIRIESDIDRRGKYIALTDNALEICENIVEFEENYNEQITKNNIL